MFSAGLPHRLPPHTHASLPAPCYAGRLAYLRGEKSARLCLSPSVDITALGFYALVCGVLSVAAPRFGAAFVRFGLGAAIGVLAALILPSPRVILGL